MKTFFTTLVVSLLGVYAVNQLAFDGVLQARLIADSFWVIGIFMFFIGLVAVTGAGKVFQGFSYTFNYLFKRSTVKKSYFEYSQGKREQIPRNIAYSIFGIGIVFIVISLLVA